MLESFYEARDSVERIRQKSQDILKLLSNAASRIRKKEEVQRSDLAACREKEKFKKL